MNQFTPRSIFATIPPERVGLRGEYDHNGLAKRVKLAFEQQFNGEEISHLQISQRGAVVILMGETQNHRLLHRLVTIAMSVHGAGAVEVNGYSVFQPLALCSLETRHLPVSSYAY